jgi:hypothetical protein
MKGKSKTEAANRYTRICANRLKKIAQIRVFRGKETIPDGRVAASPRGQVSAYALQR